MSSPGARFGGGGAGGAFSQAFAQTLIQGAQFIEQAKNQREELDLRKKLVGAQLQEHDAKLGLMERQAQGVASLATRMTDQSWPDSELSAGGTTEAAPLSDKERLKYALAIDPAAATKDMLAGGRRISLPEMLAAGQTWMGGGGATPAPAAGAAPPAIAPPTDQPAASAPPPALGPQTKLDRSFSVTIDKDGSPKLDLKVGEKHIALDMKHEFEPLPDGRIQNYRAIFNPDTGGVARTPVGAPQLPDAQKGYAQTAIAWGLKPGSETFAMAIADQAAAETMYQGAARTIAFEDLAKSYRAIASGKPTSSATASPRERAQAAEIGQAAAKTGAEETARFNAKQKETIGDDAIRFINKRTLQHPPADMKRGDVQGSEDYVQINPTQAPVIRQAQTTKTSLDTYERIVLSRADIFPPSTGSTAKDLGAITLATAKYKAKAKTDPQIGELDTLKLSLPNTVRLFGDTGNIAVAEREIASAALGLGPSTREQALARLDLVRSLVNQNLEVNGLPPIPKRSGPKPRASVVPDKGEPVFEWDPTQRRLIPVKP